MPILALLIICAVSLPILVTGQCTPDPCRNGGTCEIGYKGIGYKCKCPNSDVLNYGTNCEIANIGFHASEDGRDIRSAIRTTIGIKNDLIELVVSFEFIGRCYKESESQCHVLSLASPSDKPLLSVWMSKSDGNQTNYTWTVKVTLQTDVMPLTGKINADKWMRMIIIVTEDLFSASIVSLYPREDDQRILPKIQIQNPPLKSMADFNNATLILGGFYGCLRYVKIDKKFVDLGSFTLRMKSELIHESDHKKYASHFCYSTEKSCHSSTSQLGQRIFDSNSRTKCGANSKCNGVLDSEMDCSCRCDIGKWSRLETLNNRDRCWQNLTEQDECIDDTTTVSTGQSDFLFKWEASDSTCLNISAHAFSIEFMVLTSQVNVTPMLELKDLFTIKIVNGYLQVCISTTNNCLNFRSVLVSDDVWHEVSVARLHHQFILTIDSFSALHRKVAFNLDLICQCQITLPNSCIRGFRISDVTMPVRETDEVIDYSGKPIKFHKGSSVSVNDHCNFNKTGLTAPTCNLPCPDGEECDGPISGPPECFCKKSFD